jgi:hypothetical protein
MRELLEVSELGGTLCIYEYILTLILVVLYQSSP